jgi:tetratricopeptide (TPR) repeat protein
MITNLDKLMNELDGLSEKGVEPMVDIMLFTIEEYIKNQPENRLNPKEKQLELYQANRNELKKLCTKGLSDVEFRHEIREAFEILFTNVNSISGGKDIVSELSAKGEMFAKNIKDRDEKTNLDEKNVVKEVLEKNVEYDTFQQLLGLSNQSVDNIFLYAMQLNQEKDYLKSKKLFLLLSELNPYLFEPWIYLGICQMQLQNIHEALYAFSMASLLKFDHFLPHLYSAQCYAITNQIELAKKTLELALKFATDENIKEFSPTIDSINYYIDEK